MYTPDIRKQKCSDCQHAQVCSVLSSKKTSLENKIKELFDEDLDPEEGLTVEIKCKHFEFQQKNVRVGFTV